jgi:hypothetical protein
MHTKEAVENKNTEGEVMKSETPKEIIPEEKKIAEMSQAKSAGDFRISRRTLLKLLILVLIFILAFLLRPFFVAATVNGSPISRLAVIHKLEKASGKDVLNAMITQKLISDAAAKANVVVTPDEINTEIKRITDLLAKQGGTLDQALSQRGLTLDELKSQIITEKQVEKLVGDKATVTDADVDTYIVTNKLNISKEQLASARAQIMDQLKQQKSDAAGQDFVNVLRASAKINILVQY